MGASTSSNSSSCWLFRGPIRRSNSGFTCEGDATAAPCRGHRQALLHVRTGIGNQVVTHNTNGLVMDRQLHWVLLVDTSSLPHDDLAGNVLAVVFKAVMDNERAICPKHHKPVPGTTVDQVKDRPRRQRYAVSMRCLSVRPVSNPSAGALVQCLLLYVARRFSGNTPAGVLPSSESAAVAPISAQGFSTTAATERTRISHARVSYLIDGRRTDQHFATP